MPETHHDLLARFPWLRRALTSRLWQPVATLITLTGFVLAILGGVWGTPAGARNFGIIFVWIVWWALLIIALVPLFGRLWCAVCPIPAPGEWLQRRGIVPHMPGRLFGLGRRWPRRLRNIWLQNVGFLLVALFSTVILTRPAVTGWLLLGFLAVSVGLSVVFEGRAFCRYLCPVGGFIGLFSLLAPLELRVKDRSICQQHTHKDCLTGTACSYGCPWGVYPGALRRNAYCGLCAECLRSCPKDNIALNLRPFGAELGVAGERRLDEAYKAFIMLSCALLYPIVLLGPWGWLKQLANLGTWNGWALYAAGFLAVNLIVVPGTFWLISAGARCLAGISLPTRRLFVDYAYGLVPLGLAAWIAFSLSFVLVNGSYALPVLSDPFGWGWDLLGTSGLPWQPLTSGWLPGLQAGVLLTGLACSIVASYRIARQHVPAAATDRAWQASLPLVAYLTGFALLLMGVYLG